MFDEKNPPADHALLHDSNHHLLAPPVAVVHARNLGQGHAPAGDFGSSQMLWLLLHAVRRWWKVATPAGLLLAAMTGVLIFYSFVPMYRSSAWLRIKSRPDYVVFPERGDSQSFVRTQIQLIKSPLVLGPVVSDPAVARLPEITKEISRNGSPVDWLAAHVDVRSVGGSELFNVSVTAPDPKSAVIMAKSVVNSYFTLQTEEDRQNTQRVIELLEEERERRNLEVQRLRQSVSKLHQQALGTDPFGPITDPPIPTQRSPLQDIQSRLITAQANKIVQEARLKALEEQLAQQQVEVADAEVEQAISQRPEIQRREAALYLNEAKLRDFKTKTRTGADDPACQSLMATIDRNRQELEQMRADLRPKVREEMKTALQNQRKQEVARMRDELQTYTELEQAYTERFNSELENVKQLSGETWELRFAQADLEMAENIFNLINERITRLKTEQRAPARVVLMKEAETPTRPIEAVPYKKIILGCLLAFCFPFGLAVLGERIAQRVGDARQLGHYARLPVLGEIARLPAHKGSSRGPSRRLSQDLRLFEESIDSLRTCLALSEPLKDVQILAVTSAANNEGKTSVAVQLAVSSARASGEMALLIDGDMRSPDVHRVLGTRMNPGLAEVLNGECSLEEAIITDWSKRVHILPAGKLQGSPHKLLANGELRALLEKVRSSYRYLIIDTPPILAAAEALVFAKAADASLVCAMRDVSRMDQVNAVHDRLLAAGAKPVGLVLNGVPTKQYAYRYGTYQYDH